MRRHASHFSGDVESITAGRKVTYRAPKKRRGERLGRVIRRYYTGIPIREFDKWQDLLRKRARGCGLYALYSKKKLIYVGLATNSIRARLRSHSRNSKIPFTHFSVFLVTGRSTEAQARRIRDLEALLLTLLQPIPKWNKVKTNFIGARRLAIPT